ncbi:DUF4244 domain-containing protein [Streptomyces sp. NBC_01803]|uniref:DUF4244 domain-containing protein n=1 Tax=Streptomyces sp. NBC_01803 TaxID=2975946 RepID=UPI002DDBC05D|nr:DUF4244 domain-containing protein [Streptomyces sp. NBC_01803]WSA45500.1 DUF4244 domain-containing protein [Streptomyces sp. NBC_01803]
MWPVTRSIKLSPRWRRDAGMSTAEYAVGTLAAAALAAVLYQVVTSGAVTDALQQVVERALNTQP